MSSSDLSDQARANREFWDRTADEYQQRNAEFIERGLAWGLWQIPESELQVLGDLRGKDVLELGCGAAEWCRAMQREGARVVGLDNSDGRLRYAREANERAGVELPLVHASAETTPFDDASFDIVMADWGAPTFADPYLFVPEVARILRAGGLFAFSGATPIAWLCMRDDDYSETLQRDFFGMHRWEWSDGAVEFMLPYGEMIRLFRANGLVVEDLVEVQPAEGAPSTYRTPEDTAWARRWPMEQIWKVRKA